MATYPDDLQYTKDHEWIRVEGETGTAGISDFAQEQLGVVVEVTLPRVGERFEAGDHFGEIESATTTSELFTPASGQVIEINTALKDAPELVNTEPYGGGWMIKLKLSAPSEIDRLLSSSEYEDFIESQTEE